MVEVFDAHGAAHLCCGNATVQYDNLGGALTLNVLLSFAQFERKLIGQRIRDKIY